MCCDDEINYVMLVEDDLYLSNKIKSNEYKILNITN